MSARDVVRAVAALAPGKRVIVMASGVREPEQLKAEAPSPLQVVSQRLLERNAEIQATVTSVAESVMRIGETAEALKAVVASVAEGQVGLAHSFDNGVKEIVGTLHLPVVPTKYDKNGRIAEARRKEKK